MSLGIRRNNLNFEILSTGNPKTLVFLDSSEYVGEPERPLLELTLPGYSNYFLLNVVARKVNTFNSNTIGLSEIFDSNCLQELPDGVYDAKFKICPYDKVWTQKSFLRTEILDKKLSKVLSYIRESERDKKEFVDLSVLIEGSKANIEEGLYKKGIEQFKIAVDKTDRLLKRLTEFC